MCEDLRYWLSEYRTVYHGAFWTLFSKNAATVAGDILSAMGLLSGNLGLVYSVTSFTIGSVFDAFFAGSELYIIGKVNNYWDYVVEECGMPTGGGGDNGSDSYGSSGPADDDKHQFKYSKSIDPAGFVYEAVASNRLEGVTVTAYYQDTGGNPALWDAAEYEQVNPLVTGADGAYEWYTPSGNWLVMAEKPGYHSASSTGDPEAVDGWLPVPPPQMNVNIGMTAIAAPQVSEVTFTGSELRVLFSQYMDIAALEADNALVTVRKNGQSVPLSFRFADREVSPRDASVFYGRILYVTPAEGYDFDGELTLTVSGDFVNYAGTGIGTNYQSGPLTLGRLPGTIEHSYPNRLVTDVGDETAISVRLLDTAGEPLADRVVQVSQALDLYALPASAVTDATGKATFNAVTLRSGYDTLLFTCEEAEATLNVGVNAIGTEKPSKPSANLSDFAVVASGTQLVLSCATEGAVLRYTLDDTCPCSEDALVYDGPITLSESVFIRIAAWTETGGYSERLNLHLTVSDAAAPAADLNEDGVVDTADVSALLVRVLFEEGSPAWDRNGDSKVDALDALSLMTDGSFTNAEERPEVFVAASYDQNGRLLGFRMVDLTQPLGSVSLSFLHTAPSVRFFYLDALCAPLANAFSYAPGSSE